MRIFCRRIRETILLGWILFLAGGASAASSVSPTLQDLIDRADLIVQGRVVEARSLRDGHRLLTEVDLAVDEVFLADTMAPIQRVTVRTDGGFTLTTPVPVSAQWAGQPNFNKEGERFLVFLRRTDSHLVVVGQSRGVVALGSEDATAMGSAFDEPSADFLARVRQLVEVRNATGGSR